MKNINIGWHPFTRLKIEGFFKVFVVCLILPFLSSAILPQPVQQVDNLKAFFRSGQTFLTWQQLEGEGYHYRIYRSNKPFRDSDDLTPENGVATVHDHTSLNFSASVVFNEGRKNPEKEYEIKSPVYFCIEDGGTPLSENTGLFVYTAKTDGKAYYAVTAIKDDIESREIGNGNVLNQAVNEKVEFPGAVRQNKEDFVHWTDSESTKYYPAMSSVPGVPYNFRIKVPTENIAKPALVISLHGSGMQYHNIGMTTPKSAQVVHIAPDAPVFSFKVKGLNEIEYPNNQGWLGYNENFGTEKPLSEGKVIPYAERRVVWLVDWAQRNYNIDTDRVSMRGSSMGSMGVLRIGLTYPDKFASIHAIVPIPGPVEELLNTSSDTTIRKNIKSAEAWLSYAPAKYMEQHPEIEFPYIQATAGRLDNTVGWPNQLKFANKMMELKYGFALFWDLRAHTGSFEGTPPPGLIGPPIYWDRGGNETMPLPDFSRRQSFPALANLSVNNDPGTVNFAVNPKSRPAWDTVGAGDFIGTINGAVTWDRESIVDQKDRYEISLKLHPFAKSETAIADVTPRRVQHFKTTAGKTCFYKVLDKVSGKELVKGQVIIDSNGHVTVIKMPITKVGTRLILETAIN